MELKKKKESKKKILLIEDDYLDIISVQRTLKKARIDHELFVAHNGVEGLTLLTGSSPDKEKLQPDVILLDINMPKMNGLEFLRIVKNYYSLNNIKIFILTTSSEEYDRIAAENLGVTGYILKPFDPDHQENQKSSEDIKHLMQELIAN
jgi:CheY-like chemotaxis protein